MKPIDVYSFESGKQIDEETLEQWRETALNILLENKDAEVHSIKSGNSMVLARRTSCIDEHPAIEVIVVGNGYIEYTYSDNAVKDEMPAKKAESFLMGELQKRICELKNELRKVKNQRNKFEQKYIRKLREDMDRNISF